MEKCNAEKLEDRLRILEDCVQQQEKIIQEKEQEIDEVTEDLSRKLEEEKQVGRIDTFDGVSHESIRK